MSREELITFLKENMRIWVYCGPDGQVKVSLELCGEEITYDSDYVDLKSEM